MADFLPGVNMFMAEDTTADGLNAEVIKLKGENFDSGVGWG